jgi:hypothetical protein
MYRRGVHGEPRFVEVPAPSDEALQALLHKIVTRTKKLLTRREVLVEEKSWTYMADGDSNSDKARTLRPLQAAACTYRITFGPRAGSNLQRTRRFRCRGHRRTALHDPDLSHSTRYTAPESRPPSNRRMASTLQA